MAQRRKRAPRFVDIAKEAGVSPATVDRVLNGRESVSERRRSLVIAAAERLGTPRRLPTTEHTLIHFDILLPDNRTPFFLRLGFALQRTVDMLNKRIVAHRIVIPEFHNAAFAGAILHPPYPRHGVIVAVPDTEDVRAALRMAIGRGEAAIAVDSDVTGVEGLIYVGIDHYRSGRLAGFVLGRMARRPGRVMILSSRKDYRGHVQRVAGCRDVLASAFPDLYCDVLTTETRDDEERCYRAVVGVLKAGEPVAGIYNSGAGSSGIEAALRESGKAGKVCWVTHELSEDHRQYLQRGILDMVIDQDPDRQAIAAVQHFLHAAGLVEHTPFLGFPGEFRLYFRENLPSATRQTAFDMALAVRQDSLPQHR